MAEPGVKPLEPGGGSEHNQESLPALGDSPAWWDTKVDFP